MGRGLFSLGGFFLSVAVVLAGGFQLNDHSARSVGMAFSTVALQRDATTLYYNPAGMAQLGAGIHLSGGSAVILPGARFTGITSLNQAETYELQPETFVVPHFFAVWNAQNLPISAGLAVYAPFGLGTTWDADWIGRHLAIKTALQMIAVQPLLGYAFTLPAGKLSVAAGPYYTISSVELQRKIPTFTPEPLVKLTGDGTGIGFGAGIVYEHGQTLKLGFSYRHPVEIQYDGTVTYENVSGLEALFQESDGGTTLKFPADFRLGVAYQATDQLWVEVGANYVGWSSYDTLKIEIAKAPGDPGQSTTLVNPRNYKDVVAFRFGAEYQLSPKMQLRFGITYDPMPVDPVYVEPTLPEVDRFDLSIGWGYQFSPWLHVDLGYMGIIGPQTDVVDAPSGFDGIYNAWANIFVATFNVSL